MPQYKTTYFSELPQAQLFELVADIESYPNFIPWCEAARITKRQNEHIFADLAIKFNGLKATYGSKVELHYPEKISVNLEYGPFKQLKTIWHFHPHNSGTKISLDIEFEVSSPLFETIIGPIFEKAACKITDAFQRRAKEIYGKENG